jgi:chromosome partitioning protein
MSLVITVAQQKGGSGKTTLAAHLSVAWASPQRIEASRFKPGLKVFAVDLDPQESFCRWSEVRGRSGLSASALDVRGESDCRSPGELIAERQDADIILIDMPQASHASATSIFGASNIVIVPLQLSPMDLWATAPTIEAIKEAGSNPLVVLNRVPAHARLSDAVIAEAKGMGWRVANTCLGNRILFASSLMTGKGVTEDAPSSLAAAEIRLLAREVLAAARSQADIHEGDWAGGAAFSRLNSH